MRDQVQDGNTFYFHGQPGAAGELALFGEGVRPDWVVLNRAGLPRRSGSETGFDDLARQVRAAAAQSPARLIGFSLGAYVALEVAHRVTDVPLTIDLVSAAAPLQCGDFLEGMAGKPVFSLASRFPGLLGALTRGQSGLAHVAPQRLVSALFASAQGRDKELAADPAFRRNMAMLLRCSLGPGRLAYLGEIKSYVRDWSPLLPLIAHPVTLWHGTEDNWSPPAMADALAMRLGNVDALHKIEGTSHYSTLQAFLAAEGNDPPAANARTGSIGQRTPRRG